MTSAALVAGAIPTALGIHIFGTGEGSEFRRGLAWVLIGGITTSTLLTLLVVPTVYSLLESAVARIGGLFRRGGEDSAQETPAVLAGPSGTPAAESPGD
jgi:HAE1 family hydrophobic/amphiphilic exporter-1